MSKKRGDLRWYEDSNFWGEEFPAILLVVAIIALIVAAVIEEVSA